MKHLHAVQMQLIDGGMLEMQAQLIGFLSIAIMAIPVIVGTLIYWINKG